MTENGDFTIRKQRLQGTKFGFRWCEIHVLRVRFLCGNPRLVAFQIGNEPSLAHGDHFGAAGIRFLSTQRIGGGDLEENGHFP